MVLDCKKTGDKNISVVVFVLSTDIEIDPDVKLADRKISLKKLDKIVFFCEKRAINPEYWVKFDKKPL
jgi:hypothetical protein